MASCPPSAATRCPISPSTPISTAAHWRTTELPALSATAAFRWPRVQRGRARHPRGPAPPGGYLGRGYRGPGPARSGCGIGSADDRAATAALADIPGTTAAAPSAGATAPAVRATLTADRPAIPGLPETAAGGSAAGQGAQQHAAASAGGRAASGSSRGAAAGTTVAGAGTTVAGAKSGAGQTMTLVTSGPVIPGMPGGTVAASSATPASSRYQRSQPPAASASASATGTTAQQAFINEVAPGAIAAQHTYGVPAAVTIAQAIDESAWGQSSLAAQDNNMFGIKGSGPAGSVSLPTQEFENGQWVSITAQFRVYNNVAESIADHANLLATSGYYSARDGQQASAQQLRPGAHRGLRYRPELRQHAGRPHAPLQSVPLRPGHPIRHGTGPGSRPPGLGIRRAGHRTADRIRLGRPGRDPRTRPGVAVGPSCGNFLAVGHAARRGQAVPRGQPPGARAFGETDGDGHADVSPHASPGPGAGYADRFFPDGGPIRPHLADHGPARGGIPGRSDSAADGPRAGPGGRASTQTAGQRNRSGGGQHPPDRADARDGGRADGRAPGRRPSPRARFWISRPRPIRQPGTGAADRYRFAVGWRAPSLRHTTGCAGPVGHPVTVRLTRRAEWSRDPRHSSRTVQRGTGHSSHVGPDELAVRYPRDRRTRGRHPARACGRNGRAISYLGGPVCGRTVRGR